MSLKKLSLILIVFIFKSVLLAQPIINSISPGSGKPGETLTILGSGFSTTPSNNTVYFGASKATVNSSSSSIISVTIPNGASFDYISVITNSLIAKSTVPFMPTFDCGGGINFNAAINDSLNLPISGGRDIKIADFDLDGFSDVVSINYNTADMKIYRNMSSSFLVFDTPISIPTNTNTSLSIGDIDNDGKLDIVTVGLSADILVYKNISTPGTISFSTAITVPLIHAPYESYLGDVDGDGKLDIVTANYNSNNISVLRNTSTSGIISFAANIDFTGGELPASVYMGDIDGDGKADIAAANRLDGIGGNSVSLYLNNSTPGTISLSPKVDFTTATGPFGVSLGDIDGDGKLDLIANNFISGSVSVLRNLSTIGNLTFSPKVDFTAGNTPRKHDIADIDGDGKLDIVTTNNGSSNLSVLKNTSTAGSIIFSPKIDYPLSFQPQGIKIGDLNNDGKPEIINANSSSVTIYKNLSYLQPVITSTNNINTCSGNALNFNITSTVPTTTYTWIAENNAGVNGQSLSNQNGSIITDILNNVTGTNQLINYTITPSCLGAPQILSVNLYSLSPITISGSVSICAGSSETLTATGALSYTWSTNDNTSSIIVSPTTTTSYTVEGDDANGCVSSENILITVEELPDLSTSVTGTLSCLNINVDVVASTTTTPINYNWTGPSVVSGNFSSNATVNAPGIYSITLTSSAGCVSSGTISVSQNTTTPTLTLTATSLSVCPGNTATLTISGADTYNWFNSSTSSSVVVTPTVSSFYGVSGTNSVSGCSSSDNITIDIYQSPTVSIVPSSTNICTSGNATLTASGATTYTWSTNENTTGIVVTPTITASSYTVIGENAFGCTDTTSIYINTISSKDITGAISPSIGVSIGNITLYKYESELTQWSVVQTLPYTSTYSFNSIDSGKYVMRAVPSENTLQVTYNPSTESWLNASVINHGCAGNTTQNITILAFDNIGTGSGIITGTIVEGIGYGQRANHQSSTSVPLAPGNPIGGIIVKGGKNPGGNMFTQTTTDANGTYTITNIPNTSPGESIFVFVDVPGLDTAGNYCRTFISGETYNGLDFVIDSANVRAVNPNECLNVGLSENNFETSLNIYPNPAKDIILINFELVDNKSMKIELVDILGKSTIIDEKEFSGQKHIITYDLNQFTSGMYFLKISSNNNSINRKILITR